MTLQSPVNHAFHLDIDNMSFVLAAPATNLAHGKMQFWMILQHLPGNDPLLAADVTLLLWAGTAPVALTRPAARRLLSVLQLDGVGIQVVADSNGT